MYWIFTGQDASVDVIDGRDRVLLPSHPESIVFLVGI